MRLKGSYTVEAAVIISFCFIIFGMAIAVAYELFQLCLNTLSIRIRPLMRCPCLD